MLLAELCRPACQELTAAGSSTVPLVAVAQAVARIAGSRDVAALDDPLLMLELITSGDAPDAVIAGRVLDFLRFRATTPAGPAPTLRPAKTVTIREALAEYRESAFEDLSPNSQRTYNTWLMRLEREKGDEAPRTPNTGDLTDLIHKYAKRRRSEGRVRRVEGVGAARTAGMAFRHLWAYLDRKGYADAAVAQKLKVPPKSHNANRRSYKPGEAAIVRHLAASGRDPLLDTLVVLLAERALLRRGDICRLRLGDLDFDEDVMQVYGKGDREDVVPMTPALAAFLRRYVEARRPAHVPMDVWLRSTERLLRRGPSQKYPIGRSLTRRYVEDMLARFQAQAPEVFNDGALVLHTFRHTAATWLDGTFGPAVVQAALRHRPDTPTAHYVIVPTERLREALTAYEEHVLSWRTAPKPRTRPPVAEAPAAA
jgi:integrase